MGWQQRGTPMNFKFKHRNKLIAILTFIFIVILSVFLLKKYQAARVLRAKGRLIVALDTRIQSSDPRLIGGDAGSQYLEELRFLPLVSFDEHGNLQYVLAEKIETTSDHSWKIKIKKDVYFANGLKLTASDVAATYQEIMNPPKKFPNSPRGSSFQNVESFIANSEDEVEITLKNADASFINNLVVGILPKSAVYFAKANEVDGKGYESGPYILKKKSDAQWLLFKNKKYKMDNAPKSEIIEFKIIPDSSTRYAALIKGDVDIVQNGLDPDKVDLIERTMKDKFEVIKGTRLATTSLAFNFRNKILSDLNIRKAIAYGIDRENILKYRMHSDEEPAREMFPPGNNYFSKDIPEIKYDPEKAKEFIKRSGLVLPIDLSLKVSSSNKSNVEIAKVIGDNLKKIGINLKIEVLESSIFQDQIKKGISQIWMSPWLGFKDPDHLRFVFSSDMVPPKGGNRGAFSNLELDTLLKKGREEVHFDERKKIYDEAQLLLSQELPYFYLWHGLNVAVVSKNINGFKVYADGRYASLSNVTKK